VNDKPRRQPAGALPRELTEALRAGEFHQATRLAIAHRGLSLAHLNQRGVGVGQSTLSYWQRGLRQPEVPKALPAVRALESVLQLPADSLVVLIGPRASRGRGQQLAASFSDLRSGDMASIVDHLLADLGAYPSGQQLQLRPRTASGARHRDLRRRTPATQSADQTRHARAAAPTGTSPSTTAMRAAGSRT
jgi:hypothetical protein